MIKFLSSWIEGIAIAIIIASIFELIIPNGNIKKYLKTILGIYIVFSIISPFVNNKELYSVDASKIIDEYSKDLVNNNYTKSQINSERNLNKMYINTFEEEIKKTIEREGYIVYKCEVEGVFNSEEDAKISKVEIIIESKTINTKKDSQNSSVNNNLIQIQDVNKIEEVEINVNNKITNNTDDFKITSKDINTLKSFLSKHYEIDKKIIIIHVR